LHSSLDARRLAACVGHKPFDGRRVRPGFDRVGKRLAVTQGIESLAGERVDGSHELVGRVVLLPGGGRQVPTVHESVEDDEPCERLARDVAERGGNGLVESTGRADCGAEVLEDGAELGKHVAEVGLAGRLAPVGRGEHRRATHHVLEYPADGEFGAGCRPVQLIGCNAGHHADEQWAKLTELGQGIHASSVRITRMSREAGVPVECLVSCLSVATGFDELDHGVGSVVVGHTSIVVERGRRGVGHAPHFRGRLALAAMGRRPHRDTDPTRALVRVADALGGRSRAAASPRVCAHASRSVEAEAELVTSDDLAAVRDALSRHDWPAAFDAAEAVEVDSPELEADRADMMAEAAWWLGRLDECIAARERAHRAYDELGNQRRAGQCAVWLYEHNAMAARPAVAGAWLRRARRALADDADCVEHGALLLREAETAHGGGDLDRALSLATEAGALGRRLRSPDLEAEALQAMGRILIDQGDVDDGMGHLDEAMLLAVEGRLGPYSTGKVYCSLISACEELGDLDRAAEWTEATMKWAQQHPFAIFPGICRVHRAVVLKRRGSLAEAEREAALACEELITSHVANSAAAYAEVGDIRRRLGALARAEEAFEKAQQLCGRPCGELALLRLAQGRIDAAMSIIAACLRDTTSRLARSALLPLFVHVAIAAKDVDAACDALAELEEIAATFATPILRATVLSARGRLELAQQDEAACVTLQQALDGWQALDVPYEIATTRTLLGQALRESGDETGAMKSFTAAARLFDQIGARLDARLVFDDTKPVLPSGLTEREVEVLRLIAAGMSNNEIAGELYVSVKTVSRHLSNIFTKIGVSSRAGATAFAFEHELVDTRR
jgi:DNA-binding CsgD family transcriptional regulator